jgi:hypothetical protein
MKKTLSIVIFAFCLVISGHDSAVSAPAKIKSPAPTDVDSSQATDNKVFRGIVKKLDKGTALFTDKEIYPLVGGDFETIVGKEVNIIGKIVKEGDVEKLRVTLVQFDKI